MYGAAYATLVAYVIEALAMYFLAQRSFRLEYDLFLVSAALGVFAMALSVSQVHWKPETRPFVTVIVGFACFVTLVALALRSLRTTASKVTLVD